MSHDDTLACVVSCKKTFVSITCTVPPTGAPAQNRAKGPVFFSYATVSYVIRRQINIETDIKNAWKFLTNLKFVYVIYDPAVDRVFIGLNCYEIRSAISPTVFVNYK